MALLLKGQTTMCMINQVRVMQRVTSWFLHRTQPLNHSKPINLLFLFIDFLPIDLCMALPRHLHALVKGVAHQRWSVHLSSRLSSESAFERCLSFPSSRFYQSTSLQYQQRKADDGSSRDVVESRKKPFSELTLGQKGQTEKLETKS